MSDGNIMDTSNQLKMIDDTCDSKYCANTTVHDAEKQNRHFNVKTNVYIIFSNKF